MNHMLHIAKENVNTTQDRTRFYAYHLALPRNVGIHSVFHISPLKPFLGSGDNTITIQDLLTL